jgi:hypothetical protein
MYKMKLPLVIVFNKKDIISEEQCFNWISDYENFQVNRFNFRTRWMMNLSIYHPSQGQCV